MGWLRNIVAKKSSDGRKMKRGFVAVYVGEEKARFMVRTTFLSHPLFKELLDKAADEFEFKCATSLVLPCSISSFEEVLDALKGRRPSGRNKIKRGFVAVYAGEYLERFMVPVGFLAHPFFKVLLDEEAADEFEFGFKRTTLAGRLVLPCTASALRELIHAVQQQQGCAHLHTLHGATYTS